MILNDRFFTLKSNLEPNDTFDGLITQRHNAVRSLVEKNNPGVVETKLIGSLQRKTRIQPLPDTKFDIDILVVLGSFYDWLPPGAPGGVTPQNALNSVHNTVTESDRYGSMNPQQDAPTVTIEYADDTKVEFVPAYIDRIGRSQDGVAHSPVGRAYWIPKNGSWVLADYDHEADHISKQNTASDGWLIPSIKMLKAIKRTHFPHMGSFHVDIMASQTIPLLVQIYKQKNTPISYPQLIRDFFAFSSGLLTPSRIPGSHSPAIELHPTIFDGLKQKFTDIAAYIDGFSAQATESKKVEGWRLLFGEPFPIS